ncbi:hypothetical protein [Nostoc sp.]|uniref:hypothetical protein n=1 Tax=Nostoc sp. TaxID=1180 RepID=UPI002FF49F8F
MSQIKNQFPIPHSPFPIPNSQFPIPNSPFPIPNSQFPIPKQSLQDIAAAMPTPVYAYAKKIAKLTKEIKIKAS